MFRPIVGTWSSPLRTITFGAFRWPRIRCHNVRAATPGVGRPLSYKQPMNTLPEAHPTMCTTELPAALHRYVLAWAVMIGGLVGFWCCRPWLGTSAFNYGQLAVVLGDVEDRLAALPAAPGVGAVHAAEVSGLLRLDRHAAEAVSRGPADRRRCPDSHRFRVRPQRRHRGGVALARAATPACREPPGRSVSGSRWWAFASCS